MARRKTVVEKYGIPKTPPLGSDKNPIIIDNGGHTDTLQQMNEILRQAYKPYALEYKGYYDQWNQPLPYIPFNEPKPKPAPKPVGTKTTVLTLEALEALSLLAAESDDGQVTLTQGQDFVGAWENFRVWARVRDRLAMEEIRVTNAEIDGAKDPHKRRGMALTQLAQKMADELCEKLGSE